MNRNSTQWTTVIRPRTGWFDINIKEVWSYRDLVRLFVRRDIVTRYKQTILGPLWLVITPLLTTIVSTFVFGTVAGLESGTVPYFIFYFCGYTAWAYFASCITATASTFTANAGIFGKVYFPRLTMPFASVTSALVSFGVQFAMLIIFMLYYYIQGADIHPVWSLIWVLPILIAEMALLGLSFGILISSVTTKYRDLTSVVPILVSMWQYLTPVIYTVDSLPEKYQSLSQLNPMAPIVEAFRYILLGSGSGVFNLEYILLSIAELAFLLIFGVVIFSRVEKTFMDTV